MRNNVQALSKLSGTFPTKKINFLSTIKAGVEKNIRMCVRVWCNDD